MCVAPADAGVPCLQVHSSGCILKLEGHCPWKSHLRDIEAEKKASGAAEPPVLYVLYQDQRGAWYVHEATAQYVVRCVGMRISGACGSSTGASSASACLRSPL